MKVWLPKLVTGQSQCNVQMLPLPLLSRERQLTKHEPAPASASAAAPAPAPVFALFACTWIISCEKSRLHVGRMFCLNKIKAKRNAARQMPAPNAAASQLTGLWAPLLVVVIPCSKRLKGFISCPTNPTSQKFNLFCYPHRYRYFLT